LKKIFAVLTFVLGISSLANAGIMIEPYLGYQTGETANDPVGASPEVTDTSSGMGLGLRLGYKFILPWVALDVTQATGKYKDGTPGNTIENDTSTTQLGLVAGVEAMVSKMTLLSKQIHLPTQTLWIASSMARTLKAASALVSFPCSRSTSNMS
jgi:hypothetical protein